MTLFISIAARPNTLIDQRKVAIRVYLFETVGNNRKPTPVESPPYYHQWITRNHDWVGENPEVLAVAHYRERNPQVSPLLGAITLSEPHHKYFGYVARLYYDKTLQDERGEPKSLLTMFPSP